MRSSIYLVILFFVVIGCSPNKEKSLDYPGVVVAQSGLTLRRSPQLSSKKIGVLPFGARVTIVATNGPQALIDGELDNWYKVRFDADTGWAFGGFINWAGTNYRVQSVQLRTDSVRIQCDSFMARIAGYKINTPQFIFLEKRKVSSLLRKLATLEHSLDQKKVDSIKLKLLLSSVDTFVGAIFSNGQRVELAYYYVKTKRFLAKDIVTERISGFKYHADYYYDVLETKSAWFVDPTANKRLRRGRNDVRSKQQRGFKPKKNHLYTIRYLPAAKLKKYNIHSATNIPALPLPCKGVLLGVYE